MTKPKQDKAFNQKKVLLLLPSYSFMYEGAPTRIAAVNQSPALNIATIGGALISRGHNVKALDLNKRKEEEFAGLIRSFNPDYIGISFVTPLAEEAYRLAGLAKNIKKDVIVISGGTHSSAMPINVLEYSAIDVVCIGEADYSVLDIVDGCPYADIKGIAYKDNGSYRICENDNFITDLDSLPFPAWNLFNLSEYRANKVIAKKSPPGWIETSRGCPYSCVYCTRKVFGRNFRAKSAKRVVDEMDYMLSCGFREIHISDDCFTFDTARAKAICEEIIKRRLKFPWATVTGIRVDRVDQELLNLMKRAGCYRVFYGIETGDDGILKLIRKGQTSDQIRKAVQMSKKAGLEVYGFFMFALPGETKETMRKTIDFAKELDLDMAKATIAIPLPTTEYFKELYDNGKIKDTRWSNYNLYFPARELYEHPSIDWDTVELYFKRFYCEFYLRPNFIAKRFIKSLIKGELLDDIKAFLKTRW